VTGTVTAAGPSVRLSSCQRSMPRRGSGFCQRQVAAAAGGIITILVIMKASNVTVIQSRLELMQPSR
jgi:hypothetical protein